MLGQKVNLNIIKLSSSISLTLLLLLAQTHTYAYAINSQCTTLGEKSQIGNQKVICRLLGGELRWVSLHNEKISVTALNNMVNPPSQVDSQAREVLITINNSTSRSYNLFLPATYNKSTPLPLVIGLHGGIGTATGFESYSKLTQYAQSNNFIVAYPNGINVNSKQVKAQSWNAGDCCGPASRQSVDDVGFIRRVVQDIKTKYSVDPNNIILIGHSNGAMMAYRVACQASDIITAIAAQSGSLGITECNPANPVSILHIHGTNDKNFPIQGGKGDGVSGVEFKPARYALDTFANKNKCKTPPKLTKTKENTDLTLITWSDCLADTSQLFIIVKGASHAWMGSNAKTKPLERPYPLLDSTRIALAYLIKR
ncbi:MAG: alpha/beta hydrolase family esterase [Candidatus Paceibacterota bacterium]